MPWWPEQVALVALDEYYNGVSSALQDGHDMALPYPLPYPLLDRSALQDVCRTHGLQASAVLSAEGGA